MSHRFSTRLTGSLVIALGIAATLGAAQARSNLASPSVDFDAVSAREALTPGTSRIQGAACVYYNNTQYDAAHTTAYLLPATPYLEEWLELRKRAKRTPVAPLPASVLDSSVQTQTNGEGQFEFANLQTGRYYILVNFGFNQARTREVYAGSDVTPDEITHYYERQNYTVARGDLLVKDVIIASEGETVTAAVRNPGFWAKFGTLQACNW